MTLVENLSLGVRVRNELVRVTALPEVPAAVAVTV
jgi:hypothetical protein